MRQRLLPAALALAGAGALSAGALLLDGTARGAVVLPLALLVPGYALLRATVAGGTERDLTLTLGCSVVLSFAFYIAVALAMDSGGVRYTTEHTVIGIDIGVAVLVVAAVLRRPAAQAGRRRVSAGSGLMAVGFCVAIASAVLLAVELDRHIPKGTPEAFVEFSVENPLASASGPTAVRPGQPYVVPVRIDDHRPAGTGPARYRITARVDNGLPRTARTTRVQPGGTWRTTVASIVPPDGRLHRVKLSLRSDAAEHLLALTLYARGAQPTP